MERLEPEAVGDVLRRTLEQQNMTVKLAETRACVIFLRILGPDLARLVERPTVRNGIMSVGVPNAALRNQLLMSRSRMIQKINSILKDDIITEIYFRN